MISGGSISSTLNSDSVHARLSSPGPGRKSLEGRIVVYFKAGMPKPDGCDQHRNDGEENGESSSVETGHVLAAPVFAPSTHA
jgi:hypothetical protein